MVMLGLKEMNAADPKILESVPSPPPTSIECTMPMAKRLRELLKQSKVHLLPGVFDCISAKVCEEAGFDVIYTSGFSISGAALGLPDIGLLTGTENIEIVGRITETVSIPVIADCDTGYGGNANVHRVVRTLVKHGVAAITLEDQEWPKKCGHFEGKKIIPMEDHCSKIRTAVDARGDSGMVIIGRTDARGVLGFDEAVRRAKAYRAAGADVVFVEAMQTADEIQRVSEELKDVPLLCNYIEGGKTPAHSADDLHKIGDNYKFLMFSTAGILAATKALSNVYSYIYANGTTDGYKQHLESFANFKKLIKLDEYNDINDS